MMTPTEFLLSLNAGLLIIIMLWVAAIHGRLTGAIARYEKTIRRAGETVDHRKPHAFDPIGYAIDECECGLTRAAKIHLTSAL